MPALPLRRPGASVLGAVLAAALAAVSCLACLRMPASLLGAAFAPVVVAIVRSDLESFRIPDAANALAAALGLLGGASEGALALAAARGVAAFAAFYLFRALYRRWRGAHGLGLGDVKLAGVGAVWLDLPNFAFALDLACAAALAYVLARRWGRGEPLDPRRKLAFGAALAPAIFLVWFAAALRAG